MQRRWIEEKKKITLSIKSTLLQAIYISQEKVIDA
jgi:hypothetical protein